MNTASSGAVRSGAQIPRPRTAAGLTRSAMVDAEAFVLPERLRGGRGDAGPRFADDIWDVRPFVPRTTIMTRADFTTIADAGHRRTAREYLYSRIQRGIPANQLSGTARPMKITNLYGEFAEVRLILTAFAAAGALCLADVTSEHLETVLREWKRTPGSAAGLAGVVKHLAAHGPFLTDRMSITPWPGRSANLVTGRRTPWENTTPRIPEHIAAPLIKAAVFYVEHASADLIAAQAELAACHDTIHAEQPDRCHRSRLEAFISARRHAGRGMPALPRQFARRAPDAHVSGGVVQALNRNLTGLLAGVPGSSLRHHPNLLADAAQQLGYEEGGLDTPMSIWPATGRPWRSRLDPPSLIGELTHLRTACWIVIAYLSGMRDAEVRELTRDCAFTEPGADGRTRFKLRGCVFKDRGLSGDHAEWVVLDIVHRAVDVLLRINDDPGRLFGYSRGEGHALLSNMTTRLARFAGHCNELFTVSSAPFIPGIETGSGDDAPGRQAASWPWNTRQFRRTLAWHIAHQPFGVVAGARQYKHAQVAVFEGYAGTSASGFAAEVAAEQAAARLDYVEELYRDWNTGGHSGGGAARTIDAEFHRIRAELGDLPGTVAAPARLRTMLDHLTVTLHPGVLGDCFYRAETAACAKTAKQPGNPLPMLNSCLSCPNARRSAVHLPRLRQARAQAQDAVDAAARRPIRPLQRAALTDHLDQLGQLLTQCGPATHPEGTSTP